MIFISSKKIIILILFVIFTLNIQPAIAASTAQKLNRELADTPMRGTGKVLVNQGRKYGISPYFIAAVAGKESSYGAASCYGNSKNVWGLGACGRAWNAPYFKNWTQAINYFVRFIDKLWPNAQTPWHFNGYCTGCEAEWASGVTRHMANLGSGPRVR